jgi:uncharacterized protein (UPF0333 family)
MEKKGQVFSLDVMISIILIVLALGIAMRFLEIKATETKEMTEQMELNTVGKTAAELLVNNPDITCELRAIDDSILDNLSNCIETNQNIQKTDLGLINPGNFDCRIEIEYSGLPPTTLPGQCQSPILATAKNVYSAKREIVTTNLLPNPQKRVQKAVLNNCTDKEPESATPCILTRGTVTIWVWKT